MSPLESAMNDYLRLRRSLGYKLCAVGRTLPRFVAYLDDIGASTVTIAATIAFVQDPDIEPGSYTAGHRLTAVRGFARYMSGIDPSTEIPPTGLATYQQRRRTPFLFTGEDLAELIRCARASTPFPLRAMTLTTLISLLSVTGMRVGEALRLDRTDIDWDAAVITIRDSKFGKSRQVPLASSTSEALAAYAHLRDAAQPSPSTTTFFTSLRGTACVYTHFCATFHAAVAAAGIGAKDGPRPRIHDLRHSFAVTTLLGWHREGLDVNALIPRLSTYLGHREPRFTYWYLTATPELLSHAADRLEAHLAVSS